jgi:hypothetical protein
MLVALSPGVTAALVTIAVTIAAVAVYRSLGGALSDWSWRLRGLDRPEADEGTREESLRDEVREMVVASNARRVRRGEEPLDVEAEVERKLRDLSS